MAEHLPILAGNLDVVTRQHRFVIEPFHRRYTTAHGIGKLSFGRRDCRVCCALAQLPFAAQFDSFRIGRCNFINSAERRGSGKNEILGRYRNSRVRTQPSGNLICLGPFETITCSLQFEISLDVCADNAVERQRASGFLAVSDNREQHDERNRSNQFPNHGFVTPL